MIVGMIWGSRAELRQRGNGKLKFPFAWAPLPTITDSEFQEIEEKLERLDMMWGKLFSQMAKLSVTPASSGGLSPVKEETSTKQEEFKFFAERVNPRDVTNVEDSSGHRKIGHLSENIILCI